MNWLIPSIVLFVAMGLGLAMIPDIIKDSIPIVTEVIKEFLEDDENVEMS